MNLVFPVRTVLIKHMPYKDKAKQLECAKEWKRQWRAENIAKGLRGDGKPRRPRQTKEEKAAYMKEYKKEYLSRPEVIERKRKQDRERHKERLEEEPEFKIKKNLRVALSKAVTRVAGHKRGSHIQLLGCSVEELRDHLESQWTEGMSWDNYSTLR